MTMAKQQRKLKSMRVSIGDGPPCPRCQSVTLAWAHGADWMPTPGKNYFQFWYECANRECLTTLIMPPEGKVVADAPAAPITAPARSAERHP
jgi:hypothetical protein